MERCPSGEDLIIKARKPYTITKQRESWTEEEHNRFIEALKLYGRAWQRIEEHIGTKTAVQIRSHAQKFFSKLEKEAAAKGIPLGELHDIEIPPPRPKRKSNGLYPRKVCVDVISSCVEAKDGMPSASVSSSCSKKRALDLEIYAPLEEHIRGEASGRTQGASKDSKCLESLSLFQDVPCASIPSASKGPIDASGFREFVPLVKEINDMPTDDDYSPTVEEKLPGNTDLDVGRFHILRNDAEMKLAQERTAGPKQPQTSCMSRKNKVQGNKLYPKHVPVYSIDGDCNESVKNRESDSTNLTSLSNKVGVHENLNSGTIPSISETAGHHNSASGSSVHQQFATFPPFSQFFGAQDAHRSFFNVSSTFSSVVVSTLLQNPAAHAAASLAASFWPTADVEISSDLDSETFVGGTPSRHMNHTPSMAAIAGSTVAAAASWWATHGLIPFCHPAFHNCFTFAPLPMNIIPRTETAQPTEGNGEKEVELVTNNNAKSDQQIFDPEFSEAPGAKPSPLSSSDSDESQGKGRSHALGQEDSALNNLNSTPDPCLHESLEARTKKKVDLSSCSSNALSNSEMVTENTSKNVQEGGREDPRETQLCHPSSIEKSYRRLRGCSNACDSWKEVSEEGRLAFQALFYREVLPQSFSPPRAEEGMMENDGQEKEDAALPVELGVGAGAVTDNGRVHVVDQNCSTTDGCSMYRGFRTREIGQGLLLGSRGTGFKPYKKCAMEAKETDAAPVEEKCNKRIRLEGEDSI